MSFFDDAFAADPRDQSATPEPVAYPLAPYGPDEMTAVIPVIREAETPTQKFSAVRVDDGHEQQLAQWRNRNDPAPAGGVPRNAARRTRGGRRSRLWHATTSAIAFTLLLAASAAGVAGFAYAKYNGQLHRVSVLQRSDPNIRDAARQQHAANFLMIGSDSRQGANAAFGNQVGARSDTTILVHLSPDHAHATVISIPRDAWVDIPACRRSDGTVEPEHFDMFNSAFSVGGPACTVATVQKLTGIAVTHFVEIDFSGFEAMIDAMGAVTICSPQNVFDAYSGLRLHAGDNRLIGSQALAYVRARETLGDGSDLGRIKRQQTFLGAVLRQAMTGAMLSNPGRLSHFLDAATKAITIDKDTSVEDLRTLATSMQGLDPRHVTFYTAPIADRNYTPPGTTMTGRVLLDAVKGRILYDSVINDRKPVWVQKVNGKTTVVAGPHGGTATTSPAPKTSITTLKPDTTAAQRTCSL